jgi:hypothetical protein
MDNYINTLFHHLVFPIMLKGSHPRFSRAFTPLKQKAEFEGLRLSAIQWNPFSSSPGIAA